MDDQRFDDWTKSLAAGVSRRRVLGGLAASLLALLGAEGVDAQDRRGRVTVCHKGRTIKVAPQLLRAHLEHGDTVGRCPRQGCPRGTVECNGACVDPSHEGAVCGGLAGTACPRGYRCVDDPRDDCDPRRGGADCIGRCRLTCRGERCNQTVCGAGEYCCNPSCSICAPIGGGCTEQYCGEPCNRTTCGLDEFCCNESCSTCAPNGDSCTLEFCED